MIMSEEMELLPENPHNQYYHSKFCERKVCSEHFLHAVILVAAALSYHTIKVQVPFYVKILIFQIILKRLW